VLNAHSAESDRRKRRVDAERTDHASDGLSGSQSLRGHRPGTRCNTQRGGLHRQLGRLRQRGAGAGWLLGRDPHWHCHPWRWQTVLFGERRARYIATHRPTSAWFRCQRASPLSAGTRMHLRSTGSGICGLGTIQPTDCLTSAAGSRAYRPPGLPQFSKRGTRCYGHREGPAVQCHRAALPESDAGLMALVRKATTSLITAPESILLRKGK